MLGSDLNPAARASSPVSTALTPGMRERAGGVEPDDLGVRAVGAQKNGVQLPGRFQSAV